ncbi:MAG: glycerol-3-phosphate 1-O-acyltransferase PlsY [Thermodesulfobacteriota bacterium]
MNYAIILVSYLVGSIPFGLVLGRMAGVDVRSAGSKNIGATNVTRLVGKKVGAFTLVLDALKGAGPMLVAHYLLNLSPQLVMLCGGAAFMGHCFPIYLGFKGGKGVATALGIFLFLDWLAVGAGLALFASLVATTGYVSLGSLAAALVMPLVILMRHGVGPIFYLALFVSAFVWLKHHENIRRLLTGTEKSFKKGGAGR